MMPPRTGRASTFSPPTVSVVIPTLNEQHRIRATIESARQAGADEVIVADAASTDGTLESARSHGAHGVNVDGRGRAAQMNAGAELATGDVIVFLHSDTYFTPQAVQALKKALARNPDNVGGGFQRTFRTRSPFLRITSRIGNWRARRFGWFLGDQALFVRRELFEQINGFSSEACYEDLDFSRKLRRAGPTCLIKQGVTTSPRRFKKRRFLRATLDAAIILAYMLRHSR